MTQYPEKNCGSVCIKLGSQSAMSSPSKTCTKERENSVRSAVGLTEDFKVRVGLHQGSALSPFLFATIMDMLMKNVRKEAPWDMMFADDVVLCREDKEEPEVSFERWRKVFEERRLRVSRKKMEYLQAEGSRARNGVHTGGDSEES